MPGERPTVGAEGPDCARRRSTPPQGPKSRAGASGEKGERNMALEPCRNCGKKQFNTSSRKCHACHAALRKDGTLVNVPDGYFLDEYGNLRSTNEYEISDGKLQVKYRYILEPDKVTLRGEFPKLATPPKCAHPERLSCNYGEGFARCEYMKYEGTNWICKANAT